MVWLEDDGRREYQMVANIWRDSWFWVRLVCRGDGGVSFSLPTTRFFGVLKHRMRGFCATRRGIAVLALLRCCCVCFLAVCVLVMMCCFHDPSMFFWGCTSWLVFRLSSIPFAFMFFFSFAAFRRSSVSFVLAWFPLYTWRASLNNVLQSGTLVIVFFRIVSSFNLFEFWVLVSMQRVTVFMHHEFRRSIRIS